MKQRILTALMALIVFVPFVLYGGLPFVLFTYVLATIGLIELFNMFKTDKGIITYVLAFGTLWILLFPVNNFNFLTTKVEVVILFVMLLLSYTVLTKNKFTFQNAGVLLIGTLYVAMGFYFLIVARMEGLNYVLFVLFVIWATDTGAYFVGRALGKRKLWPEISPNKTIEGAIGGIVMAIVVGIVFQIVYPFDLSIIQIILVTILVSIVGQIGDLVASSYKRHFNIKDSGKLLPGHGGILDRMDSLLFVLPLLYIINFIS